VRLDLDGLETCAGDCSTSPFGRCEHHEVEHRLGYPIDPCHPSDLAIACALRREAEFRDDDGVDYEQRILEGAQAGRINHDVALQLVAVENANRDREIESAAFEIMTALYGRSSVGIGSARRWRDDLSASEKEDRKYLEEARFNGGLTRADHAR